MLTRRATAQRRPGAECSALSGSMNADTMDYRFVRMFCVQSTLQRCIINHLVTKASLDASKDTHTLPEG